MFGAIFDTYHGAPISYCTTDYSSRVGLAPQTKLQAPPN